MNKSINKSLERGDLSTITTYQAGVLQAATHRILQKYCDEILKPYGISKMQWLIIGTILDAGPAGIRITDLARALDTTLSYLTNTINVLEPKGILQRASSDDDSRSKLVTINERFIPTAQKIEKVLRQKLRQSVYAKVDPAEFRIYMKVQSQLARVDLDLT